MASVQRLRHAALAAGNLKATPECHCIIQTSGDQIAILPAEPRLVCIPVYNPRYVYGGWWEPAYPPIVFPAPVGFSYAPGFWIGFEPPLEVAIFGPLWGWGWFDWPGGRIVVNNTVFGRLDPNRAAFANGTWVHDPAHRRGVVYASAVVATRFGVAHAAPSRGAVTTFGSNGAIQVAAARFGTTRSIGPFNGAARGAVDRAGVVSRGFVGRGGPGAFHAGFAARGAAPQTARGRTVPTHFSPGGSPHGGGPGGGGHHH
jgi:Protein of unknown function (DUF3300)